MWNLNLEHDSRDEDFAATPSEAIGLTRPGERRSIKPLREKYR
jgi:hypothetical protein